MCPSQANTWSMAAPRRQRGFLIPLALFIVVVMGFLALAISRTSVQTHLSSAQELVSAQAFYAAESGAQAGMHQLFWNSGDDVLVVNGNCSGMNISPDMAGAPGLRGCDVSVSCDCTHCSATAPVSFYTITSVGTCGGGSTRATRTIRVGSYLNRTQ